MMMHRQYPLFTLLGVVALAGVLLTGCGNPYLGEAEDSLEQEDYETAIAYIDSALVEEPDNEDAHRARARTYLQWAQATEDLEQRRSLFQEAGASFDEVAARDDNFSAILEEPALMQMGQIDEEASLVFEAFEAESERGIEAFNQSDFAAAASFFGNATYLIEDNWRMHFLKGNALYNEGDFSGVIDPMNRALELLAEERQEFEELMDEAGEELEEGQREAYEGILDAMPDAYLILSQAYMETDREDDAIAILEDGEEQFPDSDIPQVLAETYRMTGQIDQARERLEGQIEANPDDASVRYSYGLVLLQDNPEEAAAQLERAAELEPQNMDIQYALGIALVEHSETILEESIRPIENELVDENREPTAEEEERLNEFTSQRDDILERAATPLRQVFERIDTNDDRYADLCVQLYQIYGALDQRAEAESIEHCFDEFEGEQPEMPEQPETPDDVEEEAPQP